MTASLAPEIAIFVRTAELGSFAAVAAEADLTASGVSRILSRLEQHLGARLLQRSTRRLALTPEGEAFLVHARRVLGAIEAAETEISSSQGRPRGHLRINSGTAFARHRLTQLLPGFLDAYPDITVEVSVGDRRIDPIAEQVDVTIRVGPLADSDLVAIRLGVVRRVIAASPAYLARRGTPKLPADLLDHDCLLLTGFSRLARWPMIHDGTKVELPVRGPIASDSADLLLDFAIAGLGIIRVGDFLGAEAIRDGRLVPLLADCHDDDPQAITALVPPGRQGIARVRAFLDFIRERL